ncbi:DUF6584 family protein [Cellulomonas carbonis]|uniref:Uncharacterized protein n=1 Tax=Cellulomonas carbonis T26 TaxID=947969 RepID=A0A0A0BP25_9CELL|nr:DUF6584 family protein [Cellulomonas carbonis]KGM08829.1 hypothetical protein N868_05965 [Cellulomonas carbonis T26]GGC18405.1 hypothetical protein GCM10010972_34570 [Cellulomonas carbonis]
MPDPAEDAEEAVAASPEELRRRRHQLKSKVMAEPQRLELREQLAAVYRTEGNLSQAGRWNYLAENADPRETNAFAKAFGDDPLEMMRALRWTGSEEDAETEVARERLRSLRKAARDRVGHQVSWDKPEPGVRPWVAILGCAGVLTILGLIVVGAISTSQWLAGLF